MNLCFMDIYYGRDDIAYLHVVLNLSIDVKTMNFS